MGPVLNVNYFLTVPEEDQGKAQLLKNISMPKYIRCEVDMSTATPQFLH